jgi:hypothetical protein
MEAINQTMNRLRSEGYLKVTPNNDTIFSYCFSYSFNDPDSSLREEVSVLPALTKDALRSIVLGAINGSIADMITVSSMYMSGFVLPQNIMLAQCWANFGLVEPASITYEEAISIIKEDYTAALRRLRDDVIWPSFIEDKITSSLKKLQITKPVSKLSSGGLTWPDIAGIKVDLLYKAVKAEDGKWCTYLYAGFIHLNGGILYTTDLLRHLNIPKELGMIRNRRTVPNYVPFGDGVKLYVVQGTLTLPKSKRQEMKINFPDVKSLSSLWDTYLESVNRERLNDFSHSKIALREKLASALKAVKSTNKPSEIKALKKTVKSIKQSMLTVELDSKEAYLKTLPETYLQFVATNLLVYNNGRVVVPKLRLDKSNHLSSLGFCTLNHALVKLNCWLLTKPKKSELSNILEKARSTFPDYTITGLFIKPDVESVCIRKCFYYRGESK